MFGRVIPTQETIAKINAVTPEDIQRSAIRQFHQAPTLAALGPVSKVPRLDTVVGTLSA